MKMRRKQSYNKPNVSLLWICNQERFQRIKKCENGYSEKVSSCSCSPSKVQ